MIFVAAHDAGGALLLAHWLLNTKTLFHAHVEGPACAIFNEIFGDYSKRDFRSGLAGYKFVLTATSWQSSHEKLVRIKARADKVRSISILDHWVNYKDRFLLQDKLLLPDEIWVPDNDAFIIASSIFSEVCIQLVPNYHHQYVKCAYESISRSKGSLKRGKHSIQSTALYVFEPISEHSKKVSENTGSAYWNYDEYGAFEFFLSQLHKLPTQVTEIILRPHPSEPQDKYMKLFQDSPILIHGSRNKSLVDDFCEAGLVVGCESMAMILASYCGIDAYSSIPPNCGPCSLPSSQVKMIRDL